MKQLKITTIIILLSLNCIAQEKKDTTIQVTLNINDYRALIYAIDGNIDSKKASKDIIDFIAKHAAMLPPKKEEEKKK